MPSMADIQAALASAGLQPAEVSRWAIAAQDSMNRGATLDEVVLRIRATIGANNLQTAVEQIQAANPTLSQGMVLSMIGNPSNMDYAPQPAQPDRLSALINSVSGPVTGAVSAVSTDSAKAILVSFGFLLVLLFALRKR